VIVNGMKNINQLIEIHVENYMTMSEISSLVRPDVKARLEKALSIYVDSESQMPVKELSELLIDVRTRKSAIIYLIAWTLLSGISSSADPKQTLLPSELIMFINQIPQQNTDWHLFQTALGKWRAISTFLLFPLGAKTQNPRRERELRSNIERIITCLNETLRPFHNIQIDSLSRNDNLAAMIRATAEFGLLLFSQPISWSVRWDDLSAQLGHLDENEIAHRRNLIVFPALEKIAVDERTGRFGRKPIQVLSAVLDRNIEIGG